MAALDLLLNWTHILCMTVFLGGMCFATFFLMPVVKVQLDQEHRHALVSRLIPRIRGVMRYVVVLLVLSGAARALLLHLRHAGPPGSLRLSLFALKLALAGATIAIFALAPRILGGKSRLCCDPDAQTQSFPKVFTRPGEVLHYIAISCAALAAFCGLALRRIG